MILKVEDLSFSYPSKKVLNNISFTANAGEVVAIVGPNGSGKSTLLRCIDQINRLDSGKISVNNTDISTFDRMDLQKKIAFVEQDEIPSNTNVFETILLGRRPYITWDASPKDRAIVQRIIEALEIKDLQMKSFDKISGGERQMVRVARGLAQQPTVLILDEPTNNLDLKNQYELLDIVTRVVKENNMVALIAIHDLSLALRFADKFVMMQQGNLYSFGDSSIITPESIHDVYGISAEIGKINGYPVVVPILDSVAPDKSKNEKEFFDSNAHHWDEISPHDLSIVREIVEMLELKGKEKILDVGTGTGIMIPFYREKTSSWITAVDFSEKMIEVSKSKYPAKKYRVKYVVSDINEFESEQLFDDIVCYSCFPHFQNKKETMQHLVSLLNEGGRLMISHGCSRESINKTHREGGKTIENDRVPDIDSMTKMMGSCGLKIAKTVDNDRMYVVVGILEKNQFQS